MSDKSMNTEVEIIIKHKSRYLDRVFNYLAPSDIKEGQRVEVPFGKGNRIHEGLVINIPEPNSGERTGENRELKEISSVKESAPLISPEALRVAMWMKNQYMCSMFEAVSLFFPKAEKTALRYRRVLVPAVSREEIEAYRDSQRKNAKNRITLAQELMDGPADLMEIQEKHRVIFGQAVRQLEEDGIAYVEKRLEIRKPDESYTIRTKDIVLTQEQESAYAGITQTLGNGKPKLLFGITGSGKTEIYIRLIADALENDRSAILLVPEISLTPQTIARFRNVFADTIAIMHSHLSEGEKKDQWAMIESGQAQIVIGARSAVFSPLSNLGIIIIDECHDDAYKSEQSPKYDTVEVAEKIAEQMGASLILGSATPTIEQFYRAKCGEFDLFRLTGRVNAFLPEIEITDTLDELRSGSDSLINQHIKQRIQEETDKGRQVIIFLNKRGFATSLTCTECAHTPKCPDCDITLNYHKSGKKLMCHYCGYTRPYDGICSECSANSMREIGAGTQKIEEDIRQSIRGAKTVRLDRDTTTRKGEYERLLMQFKDQHANILIGTQMISKGLDFEDVTLVVVLNADQGLRFPDYRSYEKTFSMVSQVAGRAGRGENRGSVIVQTIEKDNEIFEYIKNNDYEGLYETEIRARRDFGYPPFGTIVRIVTGSTSIARAANTAEKVKDAINFYSGKKGAEFTPLGPTPCIIQRIEKKYRWQLFYKIHGDREISLLKNIINFILSEKRSIIIDEDTSVSVDVNPKNMM